jgi:hypothetical protein
MTDDEMKVELERLREQRAGFIETIERQAKLIAGLKAEVQWLAERVRHPRSTGHNAAKLGINDYTETVRSR